MAGGRGPGRSLAPVVAMLADTADSGAFLGEDLLAYLLLAFGGALLVGNLLALFRPPPAMQAEGRRAPVGRSIVMALVGAVAFVWALATLTG
jgi:hypothetical protein